MTTQSRPETNPYERWSLTKAWPGLTVGCSLRPGFHRTELSTGEMHRRYKKVLLPAFGIPEAKEFLPIFTHVVTRVSGVPPFLRLFRLIPCLSWQIVGLTNSRTKGLPGSSTSQMV